MNRYTLVLLPLVILSGALFLSGFLVGTRNESKLETFQKTRAGFKRNETPPQIVFPGQKVSDPLLEKSFEQSDKASDLFPIERMVYLEQTNQSMIGLLSDVLFLDGFWFVVEQGNGNGVLKFDGEGRFLGRIGDFGKGPGEYMYPTRIERVFDHHLGIYDHQEGRILVFRTQGDFVLSSPIGRQTGWVILGGPGFVWDEMDRLYSPNFSSPYEEDPWHGLFKVQFRNDGVPNQLIMQYGFGKRENFYRKLTGKTRSFSCFRKVDKTLWTGSPFSSMIDVFDLEGRFLKQLAGPCPNGLDHERYRELLEEDANARIVGRFGLNIGIEVVGDLVLIDHGPDGFLLFDTNGNLIGDEHLQNDLGPIFDTFNGTIITGFHRDLNPANHPEEIHLLSQTKFEKDGNPALRIGRLTY